MMKSIVAIFILALLLGNGCVQNSPPQSDSTPDSLFHTISGDTIRINYITKENISAYTVLDSTLISYFKLYSFPVLPKEVEHYPSRENEPCLILGKISISEYYDGFLIGVPHEYGWTNVALKIYNKKNQAISGTSYWVGTYFGDGGSESFLSSQFISGNKSWKPRLVFRDSSSFVDPGDTAEAETHTATYEYEFEDGLFREKKLE